MKKEFILKTALVISGILLYLNTTNMKNPISIPGNIEQNFFVLAVGIDKGIEDDKEIRLTVLAEDFSGNTGKGSSNQAKIADVVTVEASTVFEAIRKISAINNKSVFFGHIKYLLVSEDIAKEKMLDVIDYFTRDNEVRINTTIANVKGISAESFLRSGEKTEKFIPDLLDGEFHDINKLSISEEKDVLNFMVESNNLFSGAYIPSLEIITKEKDEIGSSSQQASTSQDKSSSQQASTSQGESSSQQETKKSYYVELNGFAIFDEGKLIGHLSGFTARGLNWVNAKIESGIIIVKDSTEQKISMEIINSASKVKINLNGDIPEATINIQFSTSIGEVMSRNDIFNESEFEKINEEQKNIVKKEAESAIEYAQKNGVDILNINDEIYHQYPLKWENMKDKWKETFKTMKITVKVESRINRTFHIREPIRSKSGEEK